MSKGVKEKNTLVKLIYYFTLIAFLYLYLFYLSLHTLSFLSFFIIIQRNYLYFIYFYIHFHYSLFSLLYREITFIYN